MEIIFNSYNIKKLSVINELPKEDTNLKIQMEQKINYQFKEHSTNQREFSNRLSLTATEKTDNPRIILSVEIEGNFTISEDVLDKKKINDESLLAFLPYLSSYVGLLSALTGFPPMLIAKPDLNAPVNQK